MKGLATSWITTRKPSGRIVALTCNGVDMLPFLNKGPQRVGQFAVTLTGEPNGPIDGRAERVESGDEPEPTITIEGAE